MGGKKRTADSFVASDESCQLIKFTNYINRFINRVSCITRKDSPFRSHSYFCSRLWIQHSTDLKRKGGLQAVYGGKKRTADSFVASEESCQLIKFTNYINRFINRVSCITRKDSPFRSHSYFCSRLWIQHSTDLKRKGGLQAVYGGKETDCRFFCRV